MKIKPKLTVIHRVYLNQSYDNSLSIAVSVSLHWGAIGMWE